MFSGLQKKSSGMFGNYLPFSMGNFGLFYNIDTTNHGESTTSTAFGGGGQTAFGGGGQTAFGGGGQTAFGSGGQTAFGCGGQTAFGGGGQTAFGCGGQTAFGGWSKRKSLVPKDNIMFTDNEFWAKLVNNRKCLKNVKEQVEYLLQEFGTTLPCNRFDVGNTIEFILNDLIEDTGFDIIEMPNSKRFDVNVKNYMKISIKYSSSGYITLHNSHGVINKDEQMQNTLLLTPEKMYLLKVDALERYGVYICEFLKNTGDGLKLKRSILSKINSSMYPYVYNMNLSIDKDNCKHRLSSKVFYKEFKKEFEEDKKMRRQMSTELCR